MAVRTILVDDIDETESKDVETITYALHGATYEIDLNQKNQKALEDALAPFLAVSRKPESSGPKGGGTGRRRASTIVDNYGYDSKEVRQWAIANKVTQENGKPMGTKGVIPQSIYDAYRAVQSKK